MSVYYLILVALCFIADLLIRALERVECGHAFLGRKHKVLPFGKRRCDSTEPNCRRPVGKIYKRDGAYPLPSKVRE